LLFSHFEAFFLTPAKVMRAGQARVINTSLPAIKHQIKLAIGLAAGGNFGSRRRLIVATNTGQ